MLKSISIISMLVLSAATSACSSGSSEGSLPVSTDVEMTNQVVTSRSSTSPPPTATESTIASTTTTVAPDAALAAMMLRSEDFPADWETLSDEMVPRIDRPEIRCTPEDTPYPVAARAVSYLGLPAMIIQEVHEYKSEDAAPVFEKILTVVADCPRKALSSAGWGVGGTEPRVDYRIEQMDLPQLGCDEQIAFRATAPMIEALGATSSNYVWLLCGDYIVHFVYSTTDSFDSDAALSKLRTAVERLNG